MTSHPLSVFRPRAALACFIAALMVMVSGCGSESPSPTGSASASTAPLVVGQTSVADSDSPFKDSWDLTSHGVSEYVFMVDANGNQTSRFVKDVTQTDSLDWTMAVKSGAKFSDGTPVDAKALSWCLNQIQQKNPLSNASAGKIVFTADAGTLKARTARTTKVLPAILGEWSNVVFKTDPKGHFLYTGPYEISSMVSGAQINLKPNPSYPDASRRGDVTLKAFKDGDAMKLAMQSKSIDMAFTVTPAVAQQLRSTPGVTVKTLQAGYQYFARPNLKSGPMTDIKVRKALDLGLDRDAYLTALQGGRLATGAFAHYFSFAGKEKLEFNKAKAEALLDEAGWKKGADGIRVKNGQRLSLRLVTYSSRPDLSIIMRIMVSQLKDLGIASTTTVVDDIVAAMNKGDYDVAIYAQHTAPTGDPSFFLNQFFRSDGANNLTGYSSKSTDKMLDQLSGMTPGPARDAKAVEIQHQLREDQAIFYMVDPEWYVALSQRLSGYQPYGGDYYIINPEFGLR